MKKKNLLAILLPIQIIIVNVLGFFPEFIEKFYSNGLFVYISKLSRIIFGVVGFSIGDIIYCITIFFAVRWLWKKRKTWKSAYKHNLISIVSSFSVAYFLFNFLWALNYYRVPLDKKLGIEKKYTEQELVDFTLKLITKANQTHILITQSDTIKVIIPHSTNIIYDASPLAYQNLSKQFPFFEYKYESVKSSLISTPLSYMGFGGYLNPFTNEAQVNSNLPLYNLPTTTCHEMAHQIGYASESEANFIGYMASVHSNDVYFKYSGYTFALKYCLANISKFDKEKAKSMAKLVNKGIKLNFKESEAFNEKYASVVEDFFKYVYDNFLKINKQKDGLEGYSKFTGLLINYYRDKDL
ncbi:MAG: DUF3810 domain-containing protein [Bacteroidota bacterium]